MRSVNVYLEIAPQTHVPTWSVASSDELARIMLIINHTPRVLYLKLLKEYQ